MFDTASLSSFRLEEFELYRDKLAAAKNLDAFINLAAEIKSQILVGVFVCYAVVLERTT